MPIRSASSSLLGELVVVVDELNGFLISATEASSTKSSASSNCPFSSKYKISIQIKSSNINNCNHKLSHCLLPCCCRCFSFSISRNCSNVSLAFFANRSSIPFWANIRSRKPTILSLNAFCLSRSGKMFLIQSKSGKLSRHSWYFYLRAKNKSEYFLQNQNKTKPNTYLIDLIATANS